MHKWEKELRGDRYNQLEGQTPSFSSSLLDEIYRSICEGDTKHDDTKFYRETMPKKQNKVGSLNSSRVIEEEDDERGMAALRRACLIDKWIDQKVCQKASKQNKKQNLKDVDIKSQHDHDHDQDVLFFSSTSSSSDSSSIGFSSSDTESFHGASSKSSFFSLTRPNPVRTSVTARSQKTEKTETALFYEQRELHMFSDYHYNSATEHTPRIEESIIKSKSRALKIYNNLKKVKQPISPGGKLANFINSIFTNGNSKKSKTTTSSSSSIANCDEERKFKSTQSSTCSSASSFSRSCLSKSSPSTREKIRNGVKRSVRFYPVSIIVDEDCRPCGHKSLNEKEQSTGLMSVSLPTAWKIGKTPSRKIEDELINYQSIDTSRRVEEVAKELLKEYYQNQKKNDDQMMSDVRRHNNYNDHFEEEEEDDDDAASYSSSDLFELDHLSVIGNDRYCQELPVYETTHVDTNRAIANGLIT